MGRLFEETAHTACQKSLLTSWWTESKRPTIRNGRPAAPDGLQCSRLSVQHGRSASFASSLAVLPASLGSSAAIAATGCAASFALIGLTSRCFVPQFAIVALLRYRLQVSCLSVQHGRSASSHRPRLRRRGVPWLRTALRLVCSPLQPFGPPMCAKRTSGPPTSQFSMVAPHRSQAHLRRSLLHWAHRRLLQPLAAPSLSPSLGLLRPASATGGGLRAPLSSFR